MRTLWTRVTDWFTREGIDLDALDRRRRGIGADAGDDLPRALDFARYPHNH